MNRAVAAGQRGRDEGNRTPNPRLANTSSGRDPSRALGVDTTPEQARLCRGVTASTSWCPLLCAPDVPPTPEELSEQVCHALMTLPRAEDMHPLSSCGGARVATAFVLVDRSSGFSRNRLRRVGLPSRLSSSSHHAGSCVASPRPGTARPRVVLGAALDGPPANLAQLGVRGVAW